jgi:hypothetical protein
MKRQKYPHLRHDLERNYGITFTPKQLEELVKGDRRMQRDLRDDCTDTAVREVFSTLVVWDVLGRGRHWPCMGEGSDAALSFQLEFYPAAVRAGYKIPDYILGSLAQMRDVRVQNLSKQITKQQQEITRLKGETF